eukprot:TRINITY_DN25335_c0_g1_i3.p2 TRINITY_DN25335_c0_g1~~TRINITY_DN25335_c0_g1_i3.p2  ORF type:complete len:140 (+),score=43.93 TRINITY_DN25335_c0_g1_i3:106-525(+)
MPTSELVKRVIKAADLKSKTVSVCGEGGDQTRSFVREAGAQLGPGVPRSSNYLVIVHGLKRGSEQHQKVVDLAKAKKVVVIMNPKISEDGKAIQGHLFDDSRYEGFRELTQKEKDAERKEQELADLVKSMSPEERQHAS